MKNRILFAPALLFLLAPAARAGEIVVRLENGTDKSKGVVGAEVKLLLPTGEGGRQTTTALSIPSGDAVSIEFDGALEGKSASVLVSYKGGSYYFTDGAKLGQPEAGPFKIYEPTEDPSSIMIAHHVMQVLVEHGHVQVTEELTVLNQTQEAYLGTVLPGTGARSTLVLDVPPGAHEFGVRPEGYFLPDRLKELGELMLSDVTIPPGKWHYQYGYHLPAEGSELVFRKRIWSATHQLTIYAPQGMGYDVQVEGLERSVEEDPHSGQNLVILTGSDLPVGHEIAVRVLAVGDGEAALEDEGTRWRRARWWVLAASAAGVVLALVAFLRPNPGGAAGVEGARLGDVLVDEIARLDLSREKGEIDEAYHKREREFLKQRLLELG